MMERLTDKNRRSGTLLAKGYGVFNMMNTSYNRNLVITTQHYGLKMIPI